MKKIFINLIFFHFISGTAFAAEPISNLLDGVVAVVNGEIILASDLRYELKKKSIQTKSNSGEQPNKNLPQNVLLDQMINELILVQRAKNLQIFIEPNVVENVVKDIATRGGLTKEALRKELERRGLNYLRFKKGIEKELIFTRLREVEIESQLRISDNEIDLFLEFHANNNLSADEVLVLQYKVSFESDIKNKEKNNLKENLTKKLNTLNQKFKNNKFSNSESFENFSSMGWRSYDRLPKIFVKKVQGLKVGEFSEIVESKSGFHILYLSDKRSSILEKEIPSFKVRHILLKVDSPRNEGGVKRRATELRDQIASGEKFSDLAKNFSADIGSAKNGGELGWAYPGDYVVEFERAILKLKVNEVSQPVRTVFGYHIIELIDKRLELISPERQRTMVKLILKDNKLKETTDEWVRELRANSYVEIKK